MLLVNQLPVFHHSMFSKFLTRTIFTTIIFSLVTVFTESTGNSGGSTTCYFPIELQGTFLTQTGAAPSPAGGSDVTYSEITIEPDAIPPWGRCHKRRGNNVILKDSTGPEDCMRCIHLSLKTINVIQIHTEGLQRCYTNEEAAKATCPSESDFKDFQEIIIYRKQLPETLPDTIENVFCPINGKYKITYTANNGQLHCDRGTSELSNCPKGNELQVHFRNCPFPDTKMQFVCLGDWEGQDGQRYLALMDKSEPKNRPKYRCGIYREEASLGRVYVSLSADSTCKSLLKDAETGFETLKLTSTPSRSLLGQLDTVKCRFPEWTQGKWEKARVEGNIFKFKDAKNDYRTLTSKCIMRQPNTSNDRFVIQSTTQCGEQFYSCVWMKRRSTNILEFQFSSQTSPTFSNRLCDDSQFASHAWVTQGKKTVSIVTPCPITGDYTGEVPGENGLCAKVASDCNNPDIMFYTVSSCENRSHVFEEREYRCLGNWEEDDVLYTFTQRRDTTGYQCFSGKIMGDGQEAFIKEAGDNCIRGEDPMIYGMKIFKQAPCPRQSPAKSYVPMRTRSEGRLTPSVHYLSPALPKSLLLPPTPPLPVSVEAKSRSRPRHDPHHIPRPMPPLTLPNPSSNKDPNWYQAEVPSTRQWNRSKNPIFRASSRGNGSSEKLGCLLLVILAVLISSLSPLNGT